MYLGVVAVMLGTSLWLQSFLAVLCSAIPTALLAGRILLEERFITSHTSGYSDYCARVPFRLVPFVW
jgi:protein-S-isoprenylcysteine O-methyltransferase Ste14